MGLLKKMIGPACNTFIGEYLRIIQEAASDGDLGAAWGRGLG